MVEHQLPKLRVAGSIPVSRSFDNQCVMIGIDVALLSGLSSGLNKSSV